MPARTRSVLAGWTILRFTWRDDVDRRQALVAEVRRALTREPGMNPVARRRIPFHVGSGQHRGHEGGDVGRTVHPASEAMPARAVVSEGVNVAGRSTSIIAIHWRRWGMSSRS